MIKDAVPVEEFDDDFTAQCFLFGCGILFAVALIALGLL